MRPFQLFFQGGGHAAPSATPATTTTTSTTTAEATAQRNAPCGGGSQPPASLPSSWRFFSGGAARCADALLPQPVPPLVWYATSGGPAVPAPVAAAGVSGSPALRACDPHFDDPHQPLDSPFHARHDVTPAKEATDAWPAAPDTASVASSRDEDRWLAHAPPIARQSSPPISVQVGGPAILPLPHRASRRPSPRT